MCNTVLILLTFYINPLQKICNKKIIVNAIRIFPKIRSESINQGGVLAWPRN